jgi:hypothetical protein
MRELAGGIDSLVVSFYGGVRKEFVETLETSKGVSQRLGRDCTVVLGDEIFSVSPRGLVRMAYRLNHQFGVLGVSDSPSFPVLRWQPRAEFLHAVGPLVALQWIKERCAEEFWWNRELVSRVDLHADYQGIGFSRIEIENFVLKSSHQSIEKEHEVFTGFRFGKRSSGTMVGRIYDKSAEIQSKGGEYWYSLWGDRWEPDEVVWRVEFEMHRTVLKELGITNFESLTERVPGLWAYASQKWLTLREPGEDRTRSRWQLDARWIKIQESFLGSHTLPLERIRETQRHRELKETIPFVAAQVVRLSALLGDPDVESVLIRAQTLVQDYWDERGVSLPELAITKAIDMGLV